MGDSQKPRWWLLEGRSAKWTVLGVAVVAILLFIAGGVMLGIGIANANKSCPTQSTLAPVLLTVTSSNLTYSFVQSDYSTAAADLTLALQNVFNDSVKPDSVIVGISPSSVGVIVTFALAYPTTNDQNLSNLEKLVNKSPTLRYQQATKNNSESFGSQYCLVVNSFVDKTTTTLTLNPSTTATPKPTTVESVTTGSSQIPTETFSSQVPTETTNIFSKTTFVPTAFSKDILILLDDSTAVGNFTNFNKVKTWLVDSLIKSWKVDPQSIQIGFVTYAMREFNVLMDFDETNVDEINEVIRSQDYTGDYAPSIKRALRGALPLVGTRGLTRSTILISASDNITDIENSAIFAQQLSNNGDQLITVSMSSNDGGKLLGILSSKSSHYVGVSDFSLTDDISHQITEFIFNDNIPTIEPTTVTTTYDLACSPDVTFIIDTSSAVPNITEFRKQLDFVSGLVSGWPISLDSMQGELLIYTSTRGSSIAPGAFQYPSAQDFIRTIEYNKFMYFPDSPPSITGALQYLSQNLNNRREKRLAVTVLITYSSNFEDIRNSIPFADKIGGNLIVVGVGNIDNNSLSQLSGNVISVKQFDSNAAAKVDNVICSPTSHGPLLIKTTTTNVIETTPTTPSMTSKTTTTELQTTITPVNQCSDCIPVSENILFMVQASNQTEVDSEKQLLASLTNNWNHFERVDVLAYDAPKLFLDPIDFGDLQNKEEFDEIVNNLDSLGHPADLASAFQLALARPHPISKYGTKKMIFFTSVTDSAQIANCEGPSAILRASSDVILISMGTQDVSIYNKIASKTFSWPDMNSNMELISQLNTFLNDGVPITTGKPVTKVPTTIPRNTSPVLVTSTVDPGVLTTQQKFTGKPTDAASKLSTTHTSRQAPVSPTTSANIDPTQKASTNPSTVRPSTPTPVQQCPDCVPKTSNILLIFEAHNEMAAQQKLAKTNLTSAWNHFERVDIKGYDTSTLFLDPINFGDLLSKDEFDTIIDSLSDEGSEPDVSSAFAIATNTMPLPKYGKQNTVIFTSDTDKNHISAAKANAEKIRQKGKVVIVGMKVTDASIYHDIADVTILWEDLSNVLDVSKKVNNALNDAVDLF